MKKETIILLTFVIIACLITAFTVYQIEEFKSSKVDAAGFGISPPYIRALNLQAGDTFEQSIRVLRSQADNEQRVTARFDDLDIADWFQVLPAESIVMEKGEKYARFYFKIKVPTDAYIEKHTGKLYFAISSAKQDSGVALRLGARAEIDINIISGRTQSIDAVENQRYNSLTSNSLVEQLQGRFIMRTESRGQLYYLHPNKKEIYFLQNKDDFFKLLKEEGRGIDNDLLNKIPIDFSNMQGIDSDSDGLADLWEEAIATNSNLADTDNDGFDDLDELKNGFSPLTKDESMNYNTEFANSLSGFLLLQVDGRGQVWYINPNKNKRLLLANLDDSLLVIEGIALGVSEENYQRLLRQ